MRLPCNDYKGNAVQIRNVLLSMFMELDNGVHDGVPIDVLISRAQRREYSAEDFFVAVQAAIHDGDLVESSPGLVSVTASGLERFQESINVS